MYYDGYDFYIETIFKTRNDVFIMPIDWFTTAVLKLTPLTIIQPAASAEPAKT